MSDAASMKRREVENSCLPLQHAADMHTLCVIVTVYLRGGGQSDVVHLQITTRTSSIPHEPADGRGTGCQSGPVTRPNQGQGEGLQSEAPAAR